MTDPATDAAWDNTGVLDHFQQYRQPVADQLREIVQAAVRSFLAGDDEGQWLEVACGGGQLREWLPEETRARVLHTDYSQALLGQFSQLHPDARTMQADATALPMDDGSQAAVLGLCACDSIPRLDAARDEIRRVLRPGGAFVHFLDMQSDPKPLFASLVQSGRVPLPNFVDAPPVISRLSPEMRARLPDPGPLDDFLTIEFEPLAALLRFLESTASPFAGSVGPLVQLFHPQRFDAHQATGALMQLMSQPNELGRVCSALLSLYLQFGQGEHPGVPPLPIGTVSTVRFIESMLQREFGPEHGFEPIFSKLVSTRVRRPREAGMPREQRYLLRCVGRSEWRRDVPAEPLGSPLTEMLPTSPANQEAGGGVPAENEIVIETGMLVYAARKAG